MGITERNSNLIIGGVQDGNINLYLDRQWYQTLPGGDNGDCAIAVGAETIIFQEYQDGLWRTRLNGTATPMIDYWETSSPSRQYLAPLLLNPNNTNELFYGTNTDLKSLSGVLNTTSDPTITAISHDISLHTNTHISSIAMSTANNDIVYYSLYQNYWDTANPPYPGNYKGGIYKAERGEGGIWSISDITGVINPDDVTNNLREMVTKDDVIFEAIKQSITDIAVDPTNPDRIWVCLNGFGEGRKVFKTENGGEVWTNISACLPNLPVATIAYQPYSPDRIFIGTEIGVFFRDNTMSEWAYYGNNGPHCLVSDIEINQCSNTLICATMGRGMWKVPLPAPEIADEIITENTDYTTDKMMYKNIIIGNNATLTIKKPSSGPSPTLYMATGRTITVKSGSTLFVQNATITDMCGTFWGGITVERGAKLIVGTINNGTQATISGDPDAKWGGIEVWGNPNYKHNNITGLGPDVSLASAYINTILPTDGPGMVVLYGLNGYKTIIENGPINTITTDRRKDGYWASNYYGGIIYAGNTTFRNCQKAIEFMRFTHDNRSQIRDCIFTTNDNTRAFEGITIWACKEIPILNCKFEALPDNPYNTVGIVAGDAENLNIWQGNFQNLKYGVYLGNTSTLVSSATIENSTMENTRIGIVNLKSTLLIASENNFNNSTYGIILGGTTGYQIQNNTFDNTINGISAFTTSLETPGDNNIQCNNFLNCSSGLYVVDNNEGLQFYDNDFNTTQADVTINSNGKIAMQQGTYDSASGVYLPFFNLFTLDRPTERIISNSEFPFFYFYHTDDDLYSPNNNNRLVPHCFLGETPPFGGCTNTNSYMAIEVALPTNYSYTTCIDLGEDGGEGPLPPTIAECKTRACYNAMKAYLASLEEQKDGGDKEALLNDLYNSPEALATYQKYMDASPYLSDEVLKEMAQNPLMSMGRRANILMANAPLSDEMMSIAYDNVSASVYQVLYALKYYLKISERDRLDMRIGSETDKKENLLRELLTKFADEKDYAQLDEILNAENTTYAVRALLSSKMERGDYATAQSILDNLPATTPDEQEYKTIQQINLQFQSATEAFSLSETQYQTLHNIATAYGTQAPAACALLSLLRGEYCDWQLPTNAGSGKTERKGYPQVPLIDLQASNKLMVRPNPGNDRIAVLVPPFVVEKEATIAVFDTNGKLYQQLGLAEGQSNLNLNISDLPNGIYIVNMTADGATVATAKLVVQH